MFIAESVSEKKSLKSLNIWQSYKQERDCLVHFLSLLAVCWPGAQVHETIMSLWPRFWPTLYISRRKDRAVKLFLFNDTLSTMSRHFTPKLVLLVSQNTCHRTLSSE